MILVSGAIANKHGQGGATWTRLSWLLGLKKLGFDVFFVEEISGDACVDLAGSRVSFEASEHLRYFRRVVDRFDLGGSAALVYGSGEHVEGCTYRELLDIADASAVLVNISGHLSLDALLRRVGCRVYVDLDPGFTQFWHAEGRQETRLRGHDLYFTVGENIGTAECAIPTGGIQWRPVRQPIVLEHWPTIDNGTDDFRFTTVATWRGPYGPVEYAGRRYGLKVHEFRKFLELPARVDATFEIALDIHDAEERDRAALIGHGWRLLEPRDTVSDTERFRQYVQGSGAEFSTAQGVYVETNSGWFSDRTVRYLASGRPALVQDTGFSRNYPVGEGLVPFRTMDEAVAGAAAILRDYDSHCRAARRLAEDYFDSDKVLSHFVEQVETARKEARWIA
jgi:hypothetical protein